MASSYQGHFAYVEDILDISPSREPKRFYACHDAMEKYDTPWWHELRNDPTELAAKQIKEPVLLVNMYTFTKGVEKVLGRALKSDELSFNNKELIAEFEEKYAAIKAE